MYGVWQRHTSHKSKISCYFQCYEGWLSCVLQNPTMLLVSVNTTKPSYKSRLTGDVRMSQEHPRPIEHRGIYTGCWIASLIRGTTTIPNRQFALYRKLYFGKKTRNVELIFALKSSSYFRFKKAHISRKIKECFGFKYIMQHWYHPNFS